MNDLELFFASFCILLLIVLIIFLIVFFVEEVKNESLYQYECVTIDNEIIMCDSVKETKSGIIGKRDDTKYLLKQYKKIKKGE